MLPLPELLRNGNISAEHRGLALWHLVDKGCTSIIPELLDHGPIEDLYWTRTVKCAAHKGHNEILQELLRRKVLRHVDRGMAVLCACKGGQYEAVQMLLNQGSIPEEHRERAIAREEGHLGLIVFELYEGQSKFKFGLTYTCVRPFLL